MRSHKVYSRSALPGLHQSHQQQQHQRHHQRHSTSAGASCGRHKTSSPEMLRATVAPLSASAARHRSGSSPAPRVSALKLKSIGRSRPLPPLEPLKAGHRIDPQERIFLEAAEHGDMHTVQRCLQGAQPVNVNCTNILGRSAIQVLSFCSCVTIC